MRTAVAFTLALLAFAPAAAYSYDVPVAFEATEANRAALDDAGQANCVAEALAGAPTAACPRVATGQAVPAEGFLILDAVYGAEGFGAPVASAEATARDPEADTFALVYDSYHGANLRRTSGDNLPDLIAPGVGQFTAWHGLWDDANGDGAIQVRWNNDWLAANEWAPRPDAHIVTYLEPGSHPEAEARVRPSAGSPDFHYRGSFFGHHTRDILFTDGTLLAKRVATTVSDAVLAPSPGGAFPFTPGPQSLVDIDVYAVLAPSPLEALYGATLAGTVAEAGSPSLAWCPAGCRVGPAPLGDNPAAAVVGPVAALAWASSEAEWAEGSGNTAAGRLAAFEARHEPWIDLRPLSGFVPNIVSPQTGPMLGRNARGEAAAAPGLFAFEVWTGLWKDIGQDGVVGHARRDAAGAADPYEGGTRPYPDRYEDSEGEFLGAYAVGPTGARLDAFEVTLVPDTAWPDPGVVLVWYYGFPGQRVTGATPVVLQAVYEPGGADQTRGHYTFQAFVLLPRGSPGFTICTAAVAIEHVRDGALTRETVRDCDRIAAFAD
ncbi:MAG TPA: hypothetical protein VM889_08305 [Candidatus Thermoplasmatota archaeon]|nr:hypothetical protein [Candidatus Thermoplasmatota archaeon]